MTFTAPHLMALRGARLRPSSQAWLGRARCSAQVTWALRKNSAQPAVDLTPLCGVAGNIQSCVGAANQTEIVLVIRKTAAPCRHRMRQRTVMRAPRPRTGR